MRFLNCTWFLLLFTVIVELYAPNISSYGAAGYITKSIVEFRFKIQIRLLNIFLKHFNFSACLQTLNMRF